MRFSEVGYRVIGFDSDPDKPAQIGAGQSYFRHIASERVRQAVGRGLTATTDFARAAEADSLVLCLPTPLGEHREPDLSFVVGTLETIIPAMRAGQVVALESTTYPGTTDEQLRPRLEGAGFSLGEDCFLVYSPEREDPGNTRFTIATIPKLVSGQTAACLEVGMALYAGVAETLVPVSSPRVAEMAKLLENVHRAVNIGLVNEMKMVAQRMGIDIYEVIEAAATKPFGFVPYYPGPGLGGHCLPIDPFYLTWKAREHGVDTRFIELAGEVNRSMPRWVVERVVEALNSRSKSVRGSRVLVLGIAYKPNVDDVRESPSIEIMRQLRERGALVAYCDPYFPSFPRMRRYDFDDLRTIELSAEALASYDCVVIGTDHDLFDYELVLREAPLVVDARGRIRATAEKVFRA
jgi:UDP-N-acetyl-D-glucosamine dehydrogenase